MSDRDWGSTNEREFDSILESSMSELPPENIVQEVTPWRKAMNRVLTGMALSAVTLNFLCLNYILPAIGAILLLLGFRTLRGENKWFRACFIIAMIRAAYFLPTLVLNTTVIQSSVYASAVMSVLSALGLVLMFAMMFCLRRALRAVQKKAELPPRSDSATALIVWYLVLCLLAAVKYIGFLLTAAMIVTYILIIRSLFKVSKELDEAGYAVAATPVRMADRTLAAVIIILLLLGMAGGYLFGGSYRMDWTELDAAEHAGLEEIKEHLEGLGFPEDILDDLSAEDIAACEGALQVLTDVHEYPFNEGRMTKEYVQADPERGIEAGIHHKRVYDVKELRISGVAVELPGEREQWKIFHHFLWTEDPGFYGTESIQLWSAYWNSEGWGNAGDVTGRVLYDDNGVSYAAPYYALGAQTFTSDSIFWGEQTSTDIFAEFSMPKGGEAHRGYVSYPIVEAEDGWIVDSWINYTHQQTWLQYPAVTAMQKRISGSWSNTRAFKTIQDALQFYPTDEGAELLG